MKRAGVLHPQLAHTIASLGHGDTLVIADAGLPIPAGVERIDLAFAPGKPIFLDVLDAILSEMEVEAAVLANELNEATRAEFRGALLSRLATLPNLNGEQLEYLPHEVFKERVAQARAVVRSGEFSPYANIILRSGVAF